MVTVALLVRLEAKAGKEAEVESFLKSGLAIVQEIVLAHHGRVEVQSTINHGATFRILLRQVHGAPAHA